MREKRFTEYIFLYLYIMNLKIYFKSKLLVITVIQKQGSFYLSCQMLDCWHLPRQMTFCPLTKFMCVLSSACYNPKPVSVHHLLERIVIHYVVPSFCYHSRLSFSTPVAARSHPQTGKCHTNLQQIKNVMRHVNTLGNSGSGLPRFHRKVLHSSQTSKPNTSAPSFKWVFTY